METTKDPSPLDGDMIAQEEEELREQSPNESSSIAKTSFCLKWQKDPAYRERFLYSMFIALAFFSLGMYVGQHGPTFLDLQIITNTDLEASSAFFTGGNTGYMAGSILTGLIYNKMNKPLLLFLSLFLSGAANILVPYCTQYELMIFIRFTCGFFIAGVDTGGNAEHMRLWGTEADGLMQFLHFCFSFGGLISPLFAEPFLAEKMNLKPNGTFGNESLHLNSNHTGHLPETRVHYVFLITGIFVILTSIPFLVICLKDRKKVEKKVESRKLSQRKVPLPLLIVMLSGICMFYFVYCSVEDTFFSFLMAFVVEEYQSVSKSRGAFITAIAWAFFAIARFLMIFVIKLFVPLQLLIILTVLMAIAFSCFTIFAFFRIVDALVFFSALAAMSMSGVFPAGFSWVESEMFKVTGIISSCILVASSLGSILNPLAVGFLMEEYDNKWFCYLLLLETFLLCCILLAMIIFTKCYIDRRYGKMNSTDTQVDDIANDDSTVENTANETEVSFLQNPSL